MVGMPHEQDLWQIKSQDASAPPSPQSPLASKHHRTFVQRGYTSNLFIRQSLVSRLRPGHFKEIGAHVKDCRTRRQSRERYVFRRELWSAGTQPDAFRRTTPMGPMFGQIRVRRDKKVAK